jgi:hypothetical protein
MSAATNGMYSCPTPYVIPQVDRHGASMAEFSKQSTGGIQIYFSYGPSSTVNTTNFQISFYYDGLFNMYLSYFIIAIGNQP